MQLNNGTLLQGGKYKIVRFIKNGGFGCTYEAEHTVFDERVAIKEFFPKDFCNRDIDTHRVTVGTQSKIGLVAKLKRKFMEEAVALRKLPHPGIVKVLDIFEENDTAYYVMDYIDGCSLDDMVRSRGALTESEALGYIRQVCSALDYVHSRNRLHLDIKPGNIMIDADGRAVLIDFGTSKQYDEENGENTSTLLGMTPGYAPLEQYKKGGVQQFSPATDIYALGATLYKLLTGKTPPEADEVFESGGLPSDYAATMSSNVWMALEKAMSAHRKNRPQSISEFLSVLDDTDVVQDVELLETDGKKHYNDETTQFETYIPPVRHLSHVSYRNNVLTINGIEYPMVSVRGGSFNMGATAEQGNDADPNEKPVHRVTLSDYSIGKYEVTQDIWEAIMGNNPSNFEGPRKPVEQVSWNDCQNFILKINELTCMNFRLPTEAEWEFAARGGNNSRGYKYSGGNSLFYFAWYNYNSRMSTNEVGMKQPNELGIHDMSGNVLEWCNDWYGAYTDDAQVDPKGPESGSYRVCRGGGLDDDSRNCRVTRRDFSAPCYSLGSLGFRLCL